MELSTRPRLGNLLKPKRDGWVRLLAPSGRLEPTGLGSTFTGEGAWPSQSALLIM